MIHWLWTALNTPKLQMTVVQELGLIVAGVMCLGLIVLGVGCAYYALCKK